MLAITNAKILTIANGVIEKGTLLVKDGKIEAVGTQVEIPAGAEIIDATGKTVMPGIVEAHCHLSVFDWGDDDMDGPPNGGGGLSPATTPDLDYYWAFNPRSESLKAAVRSGVTTIITGPGSGKVISGLSLVAKTAGDSREEMVMLAPAGVKMAFGENPKRNFGGRKMMPSTRMGTAALLREALVKAQNYMRKQEKAAAGDTGPDGKPVEPPPVDHKLEPLVKVLKKELKARVHAHRHDDIMTVLRIAEEFGIECTLEHASETHKIVDAVKKSGFACVVGPTYITRVKVETREKTFETPGILEQAGIKFAITTDAPVVPIEHLRTSACLAYKEGASAEATLRAITLTAAEICGVEDRLGSIEVGKDADLVVLDGCPLEVTSRVEQVYVNGVKRFDLATHREDWEKE
ncbi:MAG: amidohydrolase [Bacillota bacterium]